MDPKFLPRYAPNGKRFEQLYAPNGKKIRGTAEIVFGLSYSSTAYRDDAGRLEPDFEGCTDHNAQETETAANGDWLYLDEDGNLWPASLVRLESEPPIEGAPEKWKRDAGRKYLTRQEIDTLLAALRLWKDQTGELPGISELATAHGPALSVEGIEGLCEELAKDFEVDFS